jgi:hypothetical protein
MFGKLALLAKRFKGVGESRYDFLILILNFFLKKLKAYSLELIATNRNTLYVIHQITNADLSYNCSIKILALPICKDLC